MAVQQLVCYVCALIAYSLRAGALPSQILRREVLDSRLPASINSSNSVRGGEILNISVSDRDTMLVFGASEQRLSPQDMEVRHLRMFAEDVDIETAWIEHCLSGESGSRPAACFSNRSARNSYGELWGFATENTLPKSAAELRTVYPRGPDDQHNDQIIEFHNLGIKDGALIAYDLPEDAIQKFNDMEKYRWWDGKAGSIEQSIKLINQPEAPRCTRQGTSTALLLPPHIPDNAHHLHNDLILKVAYLLKKFDLEPKSVSLYLLNGVSSHFENRVLMFHVLSAVLGDVIYPFEQVGRDPKNSLICHDRLLWTPTWSWGSRAGGFQPYYGLEGRWGHQDWRGVASHWASLVAREFNLEHLYKDNVHADRCGHIRSGENPRMVFISRNCRQTSDSHNRCIQNEDALIETLRGRFNLIKLGPRGPNSDLFSNPGWPQARPNLKALIEVLARADVLFGLFGSGIANAHYLRPGAVLVVMQGQGFFQQRLFLNLASFRSLPFYMSDVRRYIARKARGEFYTLPQDYIDKVGAAISERMLQECTVTNQNEDVPTCCSDNQLMVGWDFEESRCKFGTELNWVDDKWINAELTPFELARCYLTRVHNRWKLLDWLDKGRSGASRVQSSCACPPTVQSIAYSEPLLSDPYSEPMLSEPQ